MAASPFKLITLNVNGIRSAASKGLAQWVEHNAPDCMCVQEIKAQPGDMTPAVQTLGGLQGHFHCADKKGYSGTGIYTRHEPDAVIAGFGVPEFDAEGRWLELRFDTLQRKYSIISAYFPSGSSGQERQQAKYRFLAAMRAHLLQLQGGRDFVLCGDINIAHRPIDLKNWRGNQKNSGFLPEERAWMDDLLAAQENGGVGLVDVYRRLHPNVGEAAYTWWSNRGQAWAKNVGWRLDYHLATPALAAHARSAAIDKAQRFSDHAPLQIVYDAWG